MAPFVVAKPETVLKQADGLISVGQHDAALQSLTEMFAAKKFRNTPLASLEPIMLRFIQLCVDLRQGRTAKEGLMQYKNIAQNSSVASIEVVIKKFIALCDAKVEQAQEQANKIIGLADVDDLEASETPENILLGAVSGDQSRDRTDRALVTPWLKFLWEAYRTALETLKNNNRLEAIYHGIVHQAFKFCLKHQRKVEFRRLCETLRLHLANVAKYSHQAHSINLSDPDTLQSHLEARFAQLNTSVELELWQEAFRSVEDVHNLLTLAKKAPRPAMMANYYEKLAKIFLMSGSALFHAAAWGRYYSTVRAAGGKSDEELAKLAGLVLISALAVPIGADVADDAPEETKGRNARLTSLLGLSKMPTRSGLLKEALSRNTIKLAPEPIRQLYQILEVSFHPLTICSTVAPVLQTLSSSDSTYAAYLPLLHKVLLMRLLSQLSQVYSSVKISHVLELVAPLNAGPSSDAEGGAAGVVHYDHPHIEAFVMGCAQRGELQVRVDHAQGSITFGSEGFGSSAGASSSSSIRTRLSRLASALSSSLTYIAAPPPAIQEQQAAFELLVSATNEERSRLMVNRAMSARRTELLAELTARRTMEEQSRKLDATRRQQEEEERKQQELLKRRERERIEKELEDMKMQEAKKLAATLIEKGTLKVDVKALDVYDSDKLLALQVEQLDKEKKDLTERLRIVSRRLDHSERAFRREEKSLLAEDYAQQQKNDRKAHDVRVHTTRKESKQRFGEDMEAKKRLSRMMDDYRDTRKQLAGKREEDFLTRRREAQAKMEAEKIRRRDAILKERAEEAAQAEDEERRQREQEEAEERNARELREAEERREAEEAAANAAAEAKLKADEDRKLAVRREREQERERAMEEARAKAKREEEAEARRVARRPGAPVAAAAETPVWRPRAQLSSATTTPVAASPRPASPAPAGRPAGGAYRPPGVRTAGDSITPTAVASPPLARRQDPIVASPGGASGGPPKILGAKTGGWRERLAASQAAGGAGDSPSSTNGSNSPQAVASPRGIGSPRPAEGEDGFTPAKAVYKPKHLRND